MPEWDDGLEVDLQLTARPSLLSSVGISLRPGLIIDDSLPADMVVLLGADGSWEALTNLDTEF